MQPRPCAETSNPCETSLMQGTTVHVQAAAMAGGGVRVRRRWSRLVIGFGMSSGTT
jgi:hypothetical protein